MCIRVIIAHTYVILQIQWAIYYHMEVTSTLDIMPLVDRVWV